MLGLLGQPHFLDAVARSRAHLVANGAATDTLVCRGITVPARVERANEIVSLASFDVLSFEPVAQKLRRNSRGRATAAKEGKAVDCTHMARKSFCYRSLIATSSELK